jgi:hypothetical protein
MTRTTTHTKDVQAGYFRAYIVQPRKEKHRPSRRVQRMLSRRKNLASVARGFWTFLKGVYAASILYALAAAASIVEAGHLDTVSTVKAVIFAVWVAVPAAIKIGGARHA